MFHRCVPIVGVIILGAMWPLADSMAQLSYRCNVDGRAVLSDRPCTGGGATHLRAVGPTQRDTTPPRSAHGAPVTRAAEHLTYLTPECAQLNDAIRTAPSRGVGPAVVRDLHVEYQRKCGEDDRHARQQWSEAQSAERHAQRAEREARAAARTSSQREREQCHEMLRILHGKRQRQADMTPGEQADLQRFEANYQARCKG